jgi:hypothetical protein
MQIINNQSDKFQNYFMELQNNNKIKYILCIGIRHMQMKKYKIILWIANT